MKKQQPKQFFANGRAIIEGKDWETGYLIDGKMVDSRSFIAFVKGKTVNGKNRKDFISKEREADLYFEEIRYFLADSEGLIDHASPKERMREKILADIPKRKKAKAKALKEKAEKILRDDENIRMRKVYDEVRLEVLDEKIAKMEQRKAEILAEKKYHKENYKPMGLRG